MSRPELVINDNNRSSTPAGLDFIVEEVIEREPRHVQAIMESCKQGSFRTSPTVVPQSYRGLPAGKVPLVADFTR
jgi:hypothetical protein